MRMAAGAQDEDDSIARTLIAHARLFSLGRGPDLRIHRCDALAQRGGDLFAARAMPRHFADTVPASELVLLAALAGAGSSNGTGPHPGPGNTAMEDRIRSGGHSRAAAARS